MTPGAVDGPKRSARVSTEWPNPPTGFIVAVIHSHIVSITGIDGGAFFHVEKPTLYAQGYSLAGISSDLPDASPVPWVRVGEVGCLYHSLWGKHHSSTWRI